MLSWVSSGFYVNSRQKFSYSSTRDLSSFYRSANTVLTVMNNLNELVQMKLLFSVCIPILLYSYAVKHYNSKNMRMNSAINSHVRRIFSCGFHENFDDIIKASGYPLVQYTFEKAKKCFPTQLRCSNNMIFRYLFDIMFIDSFSTV